MHAPQEPRFYAAIAPTLKKRSLETHRLQLFPACLEVGRNEGRYPSPKQPQPPQEKKKIKSNKREEEEEEDRPKQNKTR